MWRTRQRLRPRSGEALGAPSTFAADHRRSPFVSIRTPRHIAFLLREIAQEKFQEPWRQLESGLNGFANRSFAELPQCQSSRTSCRLFFSHPPTLAICVIGLPQRKFRSTIRANPRLSKCGDVSKTALCWRFCWSQHVDVLSDLRFAAGPMHSREFPMGNLPDQTEE